MATDGSPSGQPIATNADAEHEALCTRCGKCCYKKVILGRTVFITPFPCEFLDTETNTCTVYANRYEKNPNCLPVVDAMRHNAFPADCGYVEAGAPAGYRPALDTWSWAHDWDDFDRWADDLEVSVSVREKVRARGPWAKPMWAEAFERIQSQQAQPSKVVDLREGALGRPQQAPSLAALAAKRKVGGA